MYSSSGQTLMTKNFLNLKKKLKSSFPEVASKYEVHYFIGNGRFGEVLFATEKGEGKTCAIKFLRKRRKDKVEREVEIMKRLNGVRNVVQYIDHFSKAETAAIVTKYFPPSDFKNSFRSFSPAFVRTYMKNLLIALSKVHSQGICHGDVKPGNFLFNKDTEKFCLIDFGSAKYFKAPFRLSGTYSYIAPEVLIKHDSSSPSVDVWSAGIIFVMLITGINPFFKPKEVIKELSYIFGTKELKDFANSYGKLQLLEESLEDYDTYRALDLKKLCVAFQNFHSDHLTPTTTNHSERCGKCRNFKKLCICSKQNSKKSAGSDLSGQSILYPNSTYDLLNRMLCLDPKNRISVAEALEHPFFRDPLSNQKFRCLMRNVVFKQGIVKALEALNDSK